jgi:hypothetical protein
MYATIRQYTVERQHMDKLMQDIREHFLPLISEVPGFVSYDVLDAGDRLVSVSVFESKEGAEQSTRRAADYVKQQQASRLGKPEITAGAVKVHQAAERGAQAGSAR